MDSVGIIQICQNLYQCEACREKPQSPHCSSPMVIQHHSIRALRNYQSSSSSRSMVPFRDSKLTHLFMGHLSGHSASRTRMIVNVNPSIEDFDETQHVLAYAIEARRVRIDQNEFTKKMQNNQPVGMHTHGIDVREGRLLKHCLLELHYPIHGVRKRRQP